MKKLLSIFLLFISLITQAQITMPTYQRVGTGEYSLVYIDSVGKPGKLYSAGTSLWLQGVGQQGNLGRPNLCKQQSGVPLPLFKKVFGGLNDNLAVDVNGDLWHVGPQFPGMPVGTINDSFTTKIAVDILGNPFTPIVDAAMFWANNVTIGWFAVKGSDSTLWVWGDDKGSGFRGDGTATVTSIIYPTQVIIPGNRKVLQIIAGNQAYARCSDGTVWTWGGDFCDNYGNPLGYQCTTSNDWKSPHQINVTNAKWIAGGNGYGYAICGNDSVMAWGLQESMGINLTGLYVTPAYITPLLGLPHGVTKIVTNSHTTHALLSDSTLWGWGNSAQGEVGDGSMLNRDRPTYPLNWAWNNIDNLRRLTPVQLVTTRHDFVNIYGAMPYTHYTYAECVNGQLYAWGRNKTGLGGNGVVPSDTLVGGMAGNYDNAWNDSIPQPVNPFTLRKSIVIPAAPCALYPSANYNGCNGYTLPANLPPTIYAGADQSGVGSTTTLTATSSPASGRKIASYVWKQIDGPLPAYFNTFNDSVASLSRLANGIYTFRITATDNYNSKATDDITVTVGGVSNQSPTASAGTDQTITLPTSIATLSGSGTDPDGTIATYSWSQLSGTTATIVSPSTASTNITGMTTAGVRTFRLTVTDNGGATGTDDITITSNAGGSLSETHNFITYDTTINVVGGIWNARITRPANMFTAGHPDTASRPAFIFMVGAGEISNPAYLAYYGPHYWLSSGWDGGIQLGNGKHYPIIISVQPYHSGPTSRSAGNLLLFLLNTYHIKPNAVHLTGLSMGAMRWELLLSVERTTGGEDYMKKITSIAALSGSYNAVGLADFIRGDLPERDSVIGNSSNPWKGVKTWVKKYNGKYFALEGISDGTQSYLWFGTQAMNDTLAGKAYFHYYAAGHCCWNTMYDPGITDWWTSGNTFLTTGQAPATQGTYQTGDNLFKWMLKQGDTTLVGFANGNQSPTADAGSAQTITLPTTTATLSGSGNDPDGSIASYGWTQVSGTTATITSASSASTTITGLTTTGVRVFRLTVTDNLGSTGTSDVTITVNAVASSVKKIVVLGSSTAAGTGPTAPQYAWVNMYTVYFKTFNASNTIVNLAVGGSNSSKIVPTGTGGEDVAQNITAALALSPNGIIVNMPTNDAVAGYTVSQTMANFRLVYNAATNAGVPIWFSTSQPRNGTLTERNKLIATKDSILAEYGTKAIDFWTTLAQSDGNIVTTYNSGDGVHLNNAGHQILYDRVVASNVITTLYSGPTNQPPTANAGANQTITLPTSNVTLSGSGTDPDGTIASYAWIQLSGTTATITSASSASTNITGLTTAGVRVFRLTVTDNLGATATSDVTITVNGQGATTLPFVGAGEYVTYFIDAAGRLTAIGNRGFSGVGGFSAGAGASGVPEPVISAPGVPVPAVSYAASHFHSGAFIEASDGSVWTAGATAGGEAGVGDCPVGSPGPNPPDCPYSAYARKILTDINGNTFNNAVSIVAISQDANTGSDRMGWAVLKADGTVWVWGTVGAMLGDGTELLDSIVNKPTQVVLPTGKIVKQITGGDYIQALCTDGTVFTWGPSYYPNLGYGSAGATGYKTPQQLSLTNITQIAGGKGFNYAVNSSGQIYGWGAYGKFLGDGSITATLEVATPMLLTNLRANLPSPISKIVTNWGTTYAILTDGSIWSWGDNTQGGIGNGESWFGNATHGYGFDYGTYLTVQNPYHVASTRTFKNIFTGNMLTHYVYAIGTDDQMYAWGTNKASTIANRIEGPVSGNIGGAYPDGWNVRWPTPVNPFNITSAFISTCPQCLTDGSFPCSSYSIPTNLQSPVSSAGADQSITGTTAVLNGTSSTDGVSNPPNNGFIAYYEWFQLTGPNTAVIDLPASTTPHLSGLVNGTYTFRLLVTDNGWSTGSDTMTLTVGGTANQSPTANAGTDQTIQLPTSTVTVTGSGIDPDGTISAYAWTQVSGTSATITSPASASTTITGLSTAGVYVFRLTVTDNQNATATDDITITVLPAGGAGTTTTINVPINAAGTTTESALLWLPSGYTTAIKYPIVVFLHGRTGSSTDFGAFANASYSAGFTNPKDNLNYKFIVLAPQFAGNWTTSGQQLDYIMKSMVANYSIDTNRIYITGLSAGGASTLEYTTQMGPFSAGTYIPRYKPAAIVPMSMAAQPSQANITTTITDSVHVWGFGSFSDIDGIYQYVYHHGTDANYAITGWQCTDGACTGLGSLSRFTQYSGGHCCWNVFYDLTYRESVLIDKTPDIPANYRNMNIYEWMLQFSRGAFGVAPNQPPVASAGADQTITLPTSSVSLSGSGTDADGTIAGYAWTQISGTTATITSPSSASTTITGLSTVGTRVFRLTVTDNSGGIGFDDISINVNPAANTSPTANAGIDQTIQLPTSTVTLSGSGNDPDGTIVSYAWTLVSGAAAIISSPSTASTGITNLVTPGVRVFVLTVTDNLGATATDSITITVNAAANVLPSANAGADQNVTLPATTATLTGSGADADGTIAGYAWTQVSGTSASITSASSATTGLTGLSSAGIRVFRLTVTDNSGGTATDDVTVTVIDASATPYGGTPRTIPGRLEAEEFDNGGQGVAYFDGTANNIGNGNFRTTESVDIGTCTDVGGGYNIGWTTDTEYVKFSVNVTTTALYTFTARVATLNTGKSIQFQVDGATAGTLTVPNTGGWTTWQTATLNNISLTSGDHIFRFLFNTGDAANDASGFDVNWFNFALVVNQSPTANAGSNQTITLPTTTTTLTGSGNDPDGTIASYAWTQISGTSATIVSTSSSTTNITGLSTAGVRVFRLTVTDNSGATGISDITITVNAASNQPPVANAGANQTITLPTITATLTGSGTDADGTIASYSWTQVSGTAATIASPPSATTNITGLTTTGVRIFRLTITDNVGATATSNVTVTVNPANIPPTASAGTNQTITLPTTQIILTGSGADQDGTVASYSWTQVSGTAATIASPSTAVTNITGLTIAGIRVFRLTVTDNQGATGTADVTITVNAANVAPTANAGPDKTIAMPTTTVTLSGSGTDADGTIAFYLWTQVSGTSATISSPLSSTTTITGLTTAGVRVFRLTVTDNQGATGTSNVTVTVNPVVANKVRLVGVY